MKKSVKEVDELYQHERSGMSFICYLQPLIGNINVNIFMFTRLPEQSLHICTGSTNTDRYLDHFCKTLVNRLVIDTFI